MPSSDGTDPGAILVPVGSSPTCPATGKAIFLCILWFCWVLTPRNGEMGAVSALCDAFGLGGVMVLLCFHLLQDAAVSFWPKGG